jgi:hypothetical protein
MAKGRRPTGRTSKQPALEAQIIPFARPPRQEGTPIVAPVRNRTIRPIDVVLLLPLIAPAVAAILLGLLGWFVAWLAIVAALVTAIICGDLARALLWRRDGTAVRALDRQPVG